MRTLMLAMVVLCACGSMNPPENLDAGDSGIADAGPVVVDAGPDDDVIRAIVNGQKDEANHAQYGTMDGGALRVHVFGPFGNDQCPDTMSIDPRMHVVIEGLPATSDGGVIGQSDGVSVWFYEASGSISATKTDVNDVRLQSMGMAGDSLTLRWRIDGTFHRIAGVGQPPKDGIVQGHFRIQERCTSLEP